MDHRKLRIAWSVAWGIAAVLLIALWVRSYQVGGYLSMPTATKTIDIVAEEGELECRLFLYDMGDQNLHFGLRDPQPSHNTAVVHFLGFEILYVDDFYCGVTFPYWFGVFAVIVMAIAPWAFPTYRFSLRTLLIATTLVAIGLGLIVWVAR